MLTVFLIFIGGVAALVVLLGWVILYPFIVPALIVVGGAYLMLGWTAAMVTAGVLSVPALFIGWLALDLR